MSLSVQAREGALDGTFSVSGSRGRVNGVTDSGLVLGIGGRMNATIEFFYHNDERAKRDDATIGPFPSEELWHRAARRYHANKNQMPVRAVLVDFGRGQNVGSGNPDNSLQNYRGKGKCDNTTDFGTSTGACVERPMRFTNTYVCAQGQNGGMPAQCTGAATNKNIPVPSGGCYDPTYITGNHHGACVFVPRVHIQDNWGWCTGKCPGDPAGDGCYDASGSGGKNECETTSSSTAWVPFKGRVVVTPP